MSRPALKLAKLPDTTPVKITAALPPSLMRDLKIYPKLYEQTYGEKQSVGALIPSMLAGFLVSDHGFKKAKRELA